MPISYTIDSTRQLVRTTATGILTDRDVLTHKKVLAADPRFRPGMRELSDVRGVTDLRVTSAGVHAMVAADAAHTVQSGAHQLAIVAGHDVVFGMARMYQTLTESTVSKVAVFRSQEDAIEWLGLDGLHG